MVLLLYTEFRMSEIHLRVILLLFHTVFRMLEV